jgi:methionine-rich copper-binding protein CopC
MSNSTLDTSLNIAVAAEEKYKLSIYPNPFRDALNIDFNNAVASDKITAEVYDVAGRLVHRQHYSDVPAGNNTLRISQIRSSERGMFMVVLKVNGKIIHTRKMLRNK